MAQPLTINEGFVCAKCHTTNPKAPKSCRNHCHSCLWSKHVDAAIPGDRKSSCQGLMEPTIITYNTHKGRQILHRCLTCKKAMVNKIAPDDNQEAIIKIMQRQNLTPLPAKALQPKAVQPKAVQPKALQPKALQPKALQRKALHHE